ncbi:MAG: hypothetical protein NUW37_05440 [Planctomycetes bacterium]|nr:hypothetical protein [Planctomycetota bacterium]
MKANNFYRGFLFTSLLLASGLGCLERSEEIAVSETGEVTIELSYKGSPKDFEIEDALPSESGGWRVSRETVPAANADEEDKLVLSATRSFAPGASLPETFGAPDDPDADVYLRFPTTLTIEQRADGKYYHFRRDYEPREWALLEMWRETLFDKELKDILAKPQEQLTFDEQVKIIRAFVELTARQHLEHAERAFLAAAPGASQDRWLLVRQGVLDKFRAKDVSEWVQDYEGVPDSERDTRFAADVDALIAGADETLRSSLRTKAGFTDEQISEFDVALAREQRASSITQEHRRQLFVVRLRMPGRIVASNADEIEPSGAAVWKFGGERFCDRTYTLMITSRVEGR